jgi:hypothetical protein
VFLAVGGAIAATAVTASPTAHPRVARETYDVLPVFVDRAGSSSVAFFYSTSGQKQSLAQSLGVFKEPAQPGDARYSDASSSSPMITPERNRTRVLIAVGSARVVAYPTKEGLVCYFLEPFGSGGCAPTLFHGALPQVSRGLVWGLLDDGATAVDVRLPSNGWLPAATGRNAFYLRLPTNVAAPSQIVVRERSGLRHVFAIKRCHSGQIGPLPGASPLSPSPC